MASSDVTIKMTDGGQLAITGGRLFVGSVVPLHTNFPENSRLVLFGDEGKFEKDTPLACTTFVDADGSVELDLRGEGFRRHFMCKPQGGACSFTAYLFLAEDDAQPLVEVEESRVIARGAFTIHYSPVYFAQVQNGVTINTVPVSLKGERGERGYDGYSIIREAPKIGYVREAGENGKWYPLNVERQQDGSLLLVVDDDPHDDTAVAPAPEADITNFSSILSGHEAKIDSALNTHIIGETSTLAVMQNTINEAIEDNQETITQLGEGISGLAGIVDSKLTTSVYNAYVADIASKLQKMTNCVKRLTEFVDGVIVPAISFSANHTVVPAVGDGIFAISTDEGPSTVTNAGRIPVGWSWEINLWDVLTDEIKSQLGKNVRIDFSVSFTASVASTASQYSVEVDIDGSGNWDVDILDDGNWAVEDLTSSSAQTISGHLNFYNTSEGITLRINCNHGYGVGATNFSTTKYINNVSVSYKMYRYGYVPNSDKLI